MGMQVTDSPATLTSKALVIMGGAELPFAFGTAGDIPVTVNWIQGKNTKAWREISAFF